MLYYLVIYVRIELKPSGKAVMISTQNRKFNMEIEQTTLDNNLKVITNKMPGFKSTAIGAFCRAGTRHETIENNGVAHFLECTIR